MKIFISFPMAGKTYLEITEEFEKLSHIVLERYPNAGILNSIITDTSPDDANQRVWYLAKCIEVLSHADLIVTCGDWKSAPGCITEFEIASRYNIPYDDFGYIDPNQMKLD